MEKVGSVRKNVSALGKPVSRTVALS
jgi:hypothetical protein